MRLVVADIQVKYTCCVFINWGSVLWKKAIGSALCDKNNMYLKLISATAKTGVLNVQLRSAVSTIVYLFECKIIISVWLVDYTAKPSWKILKVGKSKENIAESLVLLVSQF